MGGADGCGVLGNGTSTPPRSRFASGSAAAHGSLRAAGSVLWRFPDCEGFSVVRWRPKPHLTTENATFGGNRLPTWGQIRVWNRGWGRKPPPNWATASQRGVGFSVSPPIDAENRHLSGEPPPDGGRGGVANRLLTPGIATESGDHHRIGRTPPNWATDSRRSLRRRVPTSNFAASSSQHRFPQIAGTGASVGQRRR